MQQSRVVKTKQRERVNMSKFPRLDRLSKTSKLALAVPFIIAFGLILGVYPITTGNENTLFSELLVGSIFGSGILYVWAVWVGSRLTNTGGREDE